MNLLYCLRTIKLFASSKRTLLWKFYKNYLTERLSRDLPDGMGSRLD